VREDIEKVICERPRLQQDGGVHTRTHRRRLNRINGESDVKHESMRRPFKAMGRSKEFSDFLEPIKGFLKKSVGRPWNKVHSELATLLSKSTTTGRHVWTHIDQYVEKSPIFIDGRVYRGQGSTRRYGDRGLSELQRGNFYVSAHGLMLAYRKKPLPYGHDKPKITAVQLLHPLEGYVRVDKTWWHVTFQMEIALTMHGGEPDVLGVHRAYARETYGHVKGDPVDSALAFRRAVSRRRMSKKDIKNFVVNP